MILVDVTAWFLFIYLTFFVVYRFVILFNSSRGRFIDVEKRENDPGYFRKFTVLIYSHNNSSKVKALVEAFSRQTYDSEKFSLNVILDNCDYDNIKLLEIFGGARLWRINTDVKPIGKNKAFTWLLNRIRATENTNVFVFMDAECIIKTDFLEKINANATENLVIAGETIKRKKFFLNKLVNLKNKIENRVMRHGRYYSSLGNIIDTDVLVVEQDILEKVDFRTTDYGFEEYEYALRLAHYNIPVVYSSDIIVHKNEKETLKSIATKVYKDRYKAFRTFLNNYRLLFSNASLPLREMIVSLTYPSGLVFVFWNIILVYTVITYTNISFTRIISLNTLLLLVLLRVISDIKCLILLRSNVYDYRHALALSLLSPVIYLRSLIAGISLPDIGKKQKKERKKAKKVNFDKNIAHATVTNGKSEYPCTLEINKTDENASVTFIFRDKKLKSSKQPRVCYAVEEIVSKLKNNGFSLKICSNCGYFYLTESTAAHTDGEQGYCLYKNFKQGSREREYTPAWSSCGNIIPSQAGKYIRQEIGI